MQSVEIHISAKIIYHSISYSLVCNDKYTNIEEHAQRIVSNRDNTSVLTFCCNHQVGTTDRVN
jgi:hypothetical protein